VTKVAAEPDPPIAGPGSSGLVDRRWLAGIAISAIVAVPAALVTLIYIGSVNIVIDVVWERLPEMLGLPRPVVVIAIPVIGGFLVGCCVRFLPGGGGPPPAAGHGVGGDDSEPWKAIPGVIVASILSLAAGASLGPEAPLLTIVGSSAALIAARAHMPAEVARLLNVSGISSLIAGVFGSPLASGLLLTEMSPLSGVELYRRIIPALAAGTIGYFVIDALIGPPVHQLFPEVGDPELLAVPIAVGIGILGGIVGILYIEGFRRLETVIHPLTSRPILLTTLGGAVIGLVAIMFGELTLFSGEHEIGDVVDSAGTLGVSGLALLFVGKVIASLASLATGFRGGKIFPIMFLGGVLGLLVSAILPVIPAPIAVACGMGATGVSVLRIPLFMVILAAVFTSYELVPVILIAVVTSYAITVGRREL
jgi:H+/Cl- antiporter ClcA